MITEFRSDDSQVLSMIIVDVNEDQNQDIIMANIKKPIEDFHKF
jgi:dihydroorotase